MSTLSDSLPVEAGAFDDDPKERQDAVRAAIRAAIANNAPIYPARALGLEFAALNLNGAPRGLPVPEVAVSNLWVGEHIPLHGKTIEVVSVTKKRITFAVGPERTRFTTGPDMASWEQFVRDVEGLFIGAAHGCDAGDLPAAWSRDPLSRFPTLDALLGA